MNDLTILLIALGAAALIAWLIASRARPRADDSAALRGELQAMLQTQASLVSTVTNELAQVRAALQKGAADSGEMVYKAQQIVAAELKNSREMLSQIHHQLGEVQQAGANLSEASKTIERVLGAAQTRGALGEIALERLLSDALPQDRYEMQHHFSTGEAVDAVIRFHDKLLPIDSKFPLEAYRRMQEKGDEARKSFAQAVRTYADSIARKYILPEEGTLDVALMFVPSEGVYYELLMTEDSRGERLEEYCRTRKVIPVSPNSLYAYLQVILMGLRGMEVEKNARHLLDSLAGLQKQLDGFAEIYGKLGGHLRHAQQSYEEAEGKFERARGVLEQAARGALPEAPAEAALPARPLEVVKRASGEN